MRLRTALSLLLDLALAAALVGAALGVAEHARGARLEVGRVRLSRLSDAMQERLESLTDRAFITFYVSARETMPSHMRRLERDVTDLLEAMKRASGGRLDYQIVDPSSDPDLVRFASHRKVTPRRVRHVTRDSYTEQEIWSTLTISYGPRPPALIEGVGPEHLPRLQALIVEHLDRLESPRPPTLALAAGPGFDELRRWLGERGPVLDVDLRGGDPIPAEADLLFWMDPGPVTPERLAGLEDFLASGRSLVVAGSVWSGRFAGDGLEAIELSRTDYDGETLWDAFGMTIVPEVVLDSRHMAIVPAEEGAEPIPAPFRVTCIANHQDFQSMAFEVNGNLVFVAPTPIVPRSTRMATRDWRAEVLGSSSDQTWVQPLPDDGVLRLEDMVVEAGRRVPKQPLAVWLRHVDSWHGSVVGLASSSVFRDELLLAPGTAHRRLAQVLVETLASPGRLVIARSGVGRAEPLPELGPGERAVWRLLCVLTVPLVLAIVAWRRLRGNGGPRGKGRGAPSWAWPVAGRVAVGLAAVALAAQLATGRVDLTEEGLNGTHPRTRGLAAEAPAGRLELIVSSRERLPPAMRQPWSRLAELVDEIADEGDHEVVVVHPEDLDDAGRDRLRQQGVEPIKVASQDEEVTTVRTVWSTVRLTAGDRVERLDFPDVEAFEHAEFRLAFALWRLVTGRQPHVAFASDVPRLSAAEAHQHFQQKGLIAPLGKDVYAVARQALERVDFRVTHVDSRQPEMPEDPDLVVWLQPRRPAVPMLTELVDHLYRGGDAFLAVQHFNIQARQYRGRGFDFVHWPQPQSPDVDGFYLPQCGVELVREVLYDELALRLAEDAQINRTERREFQEMASALPFQIRAVASHFADHPIMAGLGDQAFIWAAWLRLHDARLAELGMEATPLVTTSEHTWTFDWSGGWLPTDLSDGPPRDASGEPLYEGRRPLAVLLEGQFPWPEAAFTRPTMVVGPDGQPRQDEVVDPYPEPEPVDAAAPGRLVLVGCSEMLKDERLVSLRPDFRGDHLLLNAAAWLTLDEGLAAVMARRPVARGFGVLAADEKLRWRGGVIGSGPLLVLLVGLVHRLVRSRPPVRARPVPGPAA